MGDKTHGDGGDPEKHTVKKGETLGGIAKKHGVSVDYLRKKNNLDPANDRKLPVDKVLDIPTVKDIAKYNSQAEVKEGAVKRQEQTTEKKDSEEKLTTFKKVNETELSKRKENSSSDDDNHSDSSNKDEKLANITVSLEKSRKIEVGSDLGMGKVGKKISTTGSTEKKAFLNLDTKVSSSDGTVKNTMNISSQGNSISISEDGVTIGLSLPLTAFGQSYTLGVSASDGISIGTSQKLGTITQKETFYAKPGRGIAAAVLSAVVSTFAGAPILVPVP